MGSLFLGIDGGQTHTAASLLTTDDHLVAHTTGGPTRIPGQDPVRTWAEALDAVLRPLEAYLPDIAAVGIGATGLGNASQLTNALQDAVHRRLPHAMVVVDNDAVAGWWGANRGRDAGILVAGTGAIAYGVESGRAVRAGGFGYLVGDEGSGSWIGLTALRHALRTADGRGTATRLTEAVARYFDVSNVPDVLRIIYAPPAVPLARIAGLAMQVGQLADDGDAPALAIIQEAARQLTDLAIHLLRQLEISHQRRFPLSPIGRTWQSSPILLDHCQQEITSVFPNVDWSPPAADASTGAAWMARSATESSAPPSLP